MQKGYMRLHMKLYEVARTERATSVTCLISCVFAFMEEEVISVMQVRYLVYRRVFGILYYSLYQ